MSTEFNIFYVRDKNIDGHRGHIYYRTTVPLLDDIYEMMLYDYCTVKIEYIYVYGTSKHVYASLYNI